MHFYRVGGPCGPDLVCGSIPGDDEDPLTQLFMLELLEPIFHATTRDILLVDGLGLTSGDQGGEGGCRAQGPHRRDCRRGMEAQKSGHPSVGRIGQVRTIPIMHEPKLAPYCVCVCVDPHPWGRGMLAD